MWIWTVGRNLLLRDWWKFRRRFRRNRWARLPIFWKTVKLLYKEDDFITFRFCRAYFVIDQVQEIVDGGVCQLARRGLNLKDAFYFQREVGVENRRNLGSKSTLKGGSTFLTDSMSCSALLWRCSGVVIIELIDPWRCFADRTSFSPRNSITSFFKTSYASSSLSAAMTMSK